jgi:hypothetical protein
MCLDSIYRHLGGRIEYEIVIIDNDSGDLDGSDPILSHDNLKFTKLSYNAGFPRANNIAFGTARGEYILMLNPDTVLLDAGILDMIRELKSTTDAGIISARVLNRDRSIQESVQDFPNLHNSAMRTFRLGWSRRHVHPSGLPVRVDSTTGAFMLFPASLLVDVGGLDEGLFWIEDIDFCYRAKLHGMATIYYPQSSVIHYGGQSAKKNANLSLYLQLTNRSRFFMRHEEKTKARILFVLTLFAVTMRYGLYCFYFAIDHDTKRLSVLDDVSGKLLRDWRFYFPNNRHVRSTPAGMAGRKPDCTT